MGSESHSLEGSPTAAGDDRFVFRWEDVPLATADVPGCGGRIRDRPSDFEVVELPAYLPQGTGSHRYVRVRKTGRTTRDLVRALQDAGVPTNQVGVAGLKDKHAVTTQWLSVPNRHREALAALEELEGVEVLERSRHRNKLGMGHLRGNWFRIRIRDPEPAAALRARAAVERLGQLGVPNFFGPQRFGRFGRNAVDGLRLVRGEHVPGDHRLKRFFLSALQSLLFNRLLARRMAEGHYRAVLVGDWAKKHDTGGEFLVEDPVEAARAERLEISALLPLYGTRVSVSDGTPGSLEADVMRNLGLAWTDFTRRRGARRISRVILEEPAVVEDDSGLMLSFALPKGAYATIVLHEVMKVDVDAPIARGGGDGDSVDAVESVDGPA